MFRNHRIRIIISSNFNGNVVKFILLAWDSSLHKHRWVVFIASTPIFPSLLSTVHINCVSDLDTDGGQYIVCVALADWSIGTWFVDTRTSHFASDWSGTRDIFYVLTPDVYIYTIARITFLPSEFSVLSFRALRQITYLFIHFIDSPHSCRCPSQVHT